MKKLNTRMIATIGMFVAIEVILSRFLSINTPFVKIGFAFVPCALCAVMLGWELDELMEKTLKAMQATEVTV